jgi:hypothetical protein
MFGKTRVRGLLAAAGFACWASATGALAGTLTWSPALVATISVVPEPATLALLSSALLGLGVVYLRRRRATVSLRSMAMVVLAATMLGEPASAGFINGSSTGLGAPADTITFDEVSLPANSEFTNAYAGLGITFSPYAVYDPYGQGQQGGPNVTGNYISNFHPDVLAVNPLSLDFSQVQSQAAFALVTMPGTTTFTALLNGVLVESDTAATSLTNPDNFFGFQNISFNQIQVSVSSSDRAWEMDNIQIGAVPEPATRALLFSALLGLGVVYLRRRRPACPSGSQLLSRR